MHFELHSETYLLEAEDALRWRNSTERKSIPIEWFRKRQTHRIYSRNGIILDYLDPIQEELAFKSTKSYTSED
ncbi:MAG: Holliday junction resolvase RecU [Exiguobacterium sp.]|nr:Holliday junction resolvase RecU [Exiguobacterium sp.]